MKVLIVLALAALAVAEAEPEADPQLLLHPGYPLRPYLAAKTKEVKPLTVTIPSNYPYTRFPYSPLPYTRLPYGGYPWMYNGFPYYHPFRPIVTAAKARDAIPAAVEAAPVEDAAPIEEAAPVEEAAPAEEVVRRKREAEPQFLVNPLVTLNDEETSLPLTYSLPTVNGLPATHPMIPFAYNGLVHPGAWPYHGFPMAYTLAKTEE